MLDELHEEHDHDEGWLVSYADMMTLLFGFFVIMYSFSQLDEKKFEEFTKAIAETFGKQEIQKVEKFDDVRKLKAFEALLAMLNMDDDIENIIKKIEKLQSEAITADAAKDMIKREITAKVKESGLLDVKINQVERLVEIVLPADLVFKESSTDLTPEARKALKEVASMIQDLSDIFEIEIVGHASKGEKPNSIHKDLWSLTAARAGAVSAHLAAVGVDISKIRATGMADTKPITNSIYSAGEAIEGYSKNRRVEIKLKVRDDTIKPEN